MSKRKITKQQSTRIAHRLDSLQKNSASSDVEQGLVIQCFGRQVMVEGKSGKRFRCSIRQHLDALVAGDQVLWQPVHETQGIVVSMLPRDAILGRVDNRGQFRPTAANISQIMVVIAPKPELSWLLLDSYLVMADYLGISVTIVLNKTDLLCDRIIEALKAIYVPLGYELICMNNQDALGQQRLCQSLVNNVNVFVGQSGVGKSSIIARLLNSQRVLTSALSTKSELGRHTTSNSCYYHLEQGGALIDSPGIRELSLAGLPPFDLARGYREFKPHLSNCQFRNCNHLDSPGCAVIHAVNNKMIHHTRYENYVKLVKKRNNASNMSS